MNKTGQLALEQLEKDADNEYQAKGGNYSIYLKWVFKAICLLIRCMLQK